MSEPDERTETGGSGSNQAPTPADPATFEPLYAPEPRTVTLTTTQLGAIACVAIIVVLGLLLGVVLATRSGGADPDAADATTAPAEAAGATAPTARRSWPPEVGGRPPGFGGRDDLAPPSTDAAAGLYLWNDFDGWHLWLVRGPGVDQVAGSIASSAEVTKAEPAAPPEANGTIAIDGRSIAFDFTGATAPVVGIDFNPGFRVESLTVAATNAGVPLGADLLRLGRGAAPVAVPYTAALTPAG